VFSFKYFVGFFILFSLSGISEENFKRSRWGVTLSTPSSQNSSIGVSVRKTTDDILSTRTSTNYYQTVFGIVHVISSEFSLGLLAYDPFKSAARETKALVGMQYTLLNYLTANLDFGGNYTSDNVSKELIYKAALQVTVLSDIFVRFGTFTDKEKKEKGNGMGLSWVQPRLSFMFGIKSYTNSTERRIKETSLAASIRF
jgi:hypothetical protein